MDCNPSSFLPEDISVVTSNKQASAYPPPPLSFTMTPKQHTPAHTPAQKIAHEFLSFNKKSKSPYHATASLSTMLRAAGFHPIRETDDWSTLLQPGGRYFFTREGSSIIAFVLPSSISPDDAAFAIIGAHTDSPCFKVKPVSKICAHGYLQVGVECYGGGLWHTWFDRDLTVAGRVVVRDEETGKLRFELVDVERPILRIPNLAIHLSRNVNTEGFKVNKETDTVPILATKLAEVMNGEVQDEGEEGTMERHHGILLKALAREIGVRAESIVDLDLCVADTQAGAIGGMLDEFVFAARLDNLASCFSGMRALVKSVESGREESGVVRMVGCFDHEEVGSRSAQGADSPLLTDAMRRVCEVFGVGYERALRRSLLVSADMAHAVHPNYAGRHDTNHRPRIGGGLVVKTNQNQRYATSGVSGLMVREAGRRAGMKVQEFVVPNDRPCGSTIGPILAGGSGLRTVDVGMAQLSMHSVREMCGVEDFALTEHVFRMLLEEMKGIEASLAGVEIDDN